MQNFVANSIEGVYPRLIGKFAFKQKLDINPHLLDTIPYDDFIDPYTKGDIPDRLDVNGLDLVVDYESTIAYNAYYNIGDSAAYTYFPVYFVNSSNQDKVLYGKDSYVLGIQEAVDRKEHNGWYPIESRGFDFCGNGKWGLIIHPQEFVLVLMRKYKGPYLSRMRVRFKNAENIMVSKSFKGTLNHSQFSVADSSYLLQRLQESPANAANDLFYGSSPSEKYRSTE